MDKLIFINLFILNFLVVVEILLARLKFYYDGKAIVLISKHIKNVQIILFQLIRDLRDGKEINEDIYKALLKVQEGLDRWE